MRKIISTLVIGSACVFFAGCSSINHKYASSQFCTESGAEMIEVAGEYDASLNQATIVSETVNFGFDSDKLAADERATLDQLVELAHKNSEATVKVIGFTDARGPHHYNQKLGLRRAQSVVNYLTEKGVDAQRFEVESLGADNVLDDADNEIAHATNRRVEVIMEIGSQNT